jgi:hypothetical protein
MERWSLNARSKGPPGAPLHALIKQMFLVNAQLCKAMLDSNAGLKQDDLT